MAPVVEKFGLDESMDFLNSKKFEQFQELDLYLDLQTETVYGNGDIQSFFGALASVRWPQQFSLSINLEDSGITDEFIKCLILELKVNTQWPQAKKIALNLQNNNITEQAIKPLIQFLEKEKDSWRNRLTIDLQGNDLDLSEIQDYLSDADNFEQLKEMIIFDDTPSYGFSR